MESLIKLDFTEQMDYVRNKFEAKKHAVLSTSAGGRVTSRSISFILLGDDLYFQTDRRFLKVRQMEENRNVAVCLENIQIEAEAEIKGNASLPENSEFREKYSKVHPGSFEMYTNGANQIIVRLKIKLISLWQYKSKGTSPLQNGEEKPYRIFIWPEKKKAVREIYDVDSENDIFIAEREG